MLELSKPPTKDELDAWPPLTPEDIWRIEEGQCNQIEPLLRGDSGKLQMLALTNAHEIAEMWPRIVNTARLLWQLHSVVSDLIDCEINCIKDGNALTPQEQDIAIKTANNIKRRVLGAIGKVK